MSEKFFTEQDQIGFKLGPDTECMSLKMNMCIIQRDSSVHNYTGGLVRMCYQSVVGVVAAAAAEEDADDDI